LDDGFRKEVNTMPKGKHLTLDDRRSIQIGLGEGRSFKDIADEIGKDPSTISKEVRNHIFIKHTSSYNPCKHLKECKHRRDLCSECKRGSGVCHACIYVKCIECCPDFEPRTCRRILSPPYVCNGCDDRVGCHLPRYVYEAKAAQNAYEEKLSKSRQGFAISYEELKRIDRIISPLVRKGQSIHHICQNNKDLIMYDEKSIYNYIDSGLLSVGNLDLPRKVRYRVRKKKRSVRVDKKCHIGRTYEEFLEFLAACPDVAITEMDTVEGRKGGKVLLTIYFKNCELMLAFIRDANTARSVTDIFNHLDAILGRESFRTLFQVIVTDRGSEFTDPLSIECDENGEIRTRIFYCDPQRSDQKGSCEVTHEMIRRVLPKGYNFNHLTQPDIDLMMSHINSYTRKKLGNLSPYRLFSSFYGEDLLTKLNIQQIAPNDINLTPKLLMR
jgi:IS30 family transposase